MIVAVYLIGLVAGMLRKQGWLVVPLAGIAPFVFSFTGATGFEAGQSAGSLMVTAMLWAFAAAAGCFVTIMVQTRIIEAWMAENRASRFG